jgi:hypothetical protein
MLAGLANSPRGEQERQKRTGNQPHKAYKNESTDDQLMDFVLA